MFLSAARSHSPSLLKCITDYYLISSPGASAVCSDSRVFISSVAHRLYPAVCLDGAVEYMWNEVDKELQMIHRYRENEARRV